MVEVSQPGVPGPDVPKYTGPTADQFENMRREAQERIYSDRERGGGYPMEGEHYYNLLRGVEIGERGDVTELVDVLERTKAYQEGLFDRTSSFLVDFDPNNPNHPHTRRALAYFRDLFLTVEGSSKRPNAPYVLIQEKQSVEVPLIEGDAWRQDEEGYRRRRRKELGGINEAKILNNQPPLSEEAINSIIAKDEARLANEYYASRLLLGISNHNEARDSLDFAFRQRMATCENPAQAAELGGEIRAVSPDSSTWESFFHTEGFSDYGQRVDAIFEEIVKFGLTKEAVEILKMSPIPDEVRDKVCRNSESGVYAEGFRDTTAFSHWMKYLLTKADNRIDVVWSAWRLALMWEVPEKLGIYIKNNNKFVLTAPPVGNALMSFTTHLQSKRTHEFGLKADGTRYQVEKFLSHSGLPLSIEKIPNLCEDFLHQTKLTISQEYLDLESPFSGKLIEALKKVKDRLPQNKRNPLYLKGNDVLKTEIQDFLNRSKEVNEETGKEEFKVKSVDVSLWDLRILGGWKFSDPTFPWLISDQPSNEKAEAGELPMGAFGFWLLTRSRASKVLEDIKSRTKLQDLGDPDFFASRLRNWVKVLGTIDDDKTKKGYVSPDINPRAVWLMSQIYYHIAGHGDYKSKAIEDNPLGDYRSVLLSQGLSSKKEGTSERDVAIGDVLYAAELPGFIREEDKNWILDELKLKLTG